MTSTWVATSNLMQFTSYGRVRRRWRRRQFEGRIGRRFFLRRGETLGFTRGEWARGRILLLPGVRRTAVWRAQAVACWMSPIRTNWWTHINSTKHEVWINLTPFPLLVRFSSVLTITCGLLQTYASGFLCWLLVKLPAFHTVAVAWW